MKFCRASLNTLRQLMRALSETDPRLSQELSRITNDAASGASMPASSTVMALSQLGLIGAESGSNLSV